MIPLDRRWPLWLKIIRPREYCATVYSFFFFFLLRQYNNVYTNESAGVSCHHTKGFVTRLHIFFFFFFFVRNYGVFFFSTRHAVRISARRICESPIRVISSARTKTTEIIRIAFKPIYAHDLRFDLVQNNAFEKYYIFIARSVCSNFPNITRARLSSKTLFDVDLYTSVLLLFPSDPSPRDKISTPRSEPRRQNPRPLFRLHRVWCAFL